MKTLTLLIPSLILPALWITGSLDAAGITGTVTASGGPALEDVEVRILDTGGNYFDLTTTDASGVFIFDALDAGSYLLWTVNDQGFIDELYDDIPCAGGCFYFGGTPVPVSTGQTVGGIDFVLQPGGRISGTVTDETTGDPVAGCDVKVYDQEESLMTIATTDGAGAYLSPTGLPAGDYFVRTANDAGYFDELYDDLPCPGACDLTGGDSVAVSLGSTTPDIDFALAPGGGISGTVTSTGDGAPIDRVRIDVYDASGAWAASATPDSSGVYATEGGLPPGTYFAVTDNWWGHVDELYDDNPCFAGCTPIEGTPITVGSGTTSGIDFALDPGGWITGVITDETTGLPIEDAAVEVYTVDGRRVTTAPADGSGVYWASGLPTGNYVARAYSWDGHLAEAWNDLPCEPDCDFTEADPVSVIQPAITGDIDFTLVQGGTITGTISREDDGTPVSEAEVQIFDAAGEPVVSVMADPWGVFDSGPLAPGDYFLLIDAWDENLVDEVYDDLPCAGFCDPEEGTAVVVTPGDTHSLSIALAVSGFLAGSVASEAGTPSADCELHVFDQQGVPVTIAFTDADGDFDLGGLPGGTYFVQTHNFDNLVDELWENTECIMWCDPTIGMPLVVTPGQTTAGIDFSLVSALLFTDGFEGGTTGAWSSAAP